MDGTIPSITHFIRPSIHNSYIRLRNKRIQNRESEKKTEKSPGKNTRDPPKKLILPPQLIATNLMLSPASTPSRGHTTLRPSQP